MKRIIVIFLLFFLTSCTNQSSEYILEAEELTKAYGYSKINYKIEEIYIEYELDDYIDVFNLYTIHQNYLPLNYVSKGSGNVGLLDSKVENNIVYYEVDAYINTVENLDIFYELLTKTNMNLGYSSVQIIYNNEKIF